MLRTRVLCALLWGAGWASSNATTATTKITTTAATIATASIPAASTASVATSAATTTTTAIRRTRTAFAYALQHFAARGFGRCRHHVAARRFAQAAPQGLATHGNRFGTFAVFGHKFRHVHTGNALLGEAFNRCQKAFFVQAHQAYGLAFFARAAGSANAVHIVFAHVRNFKVHHVRQVVNVNTACCNIGSNQRANVAAFKTCQCLRARALALVAVQRHRADAVLFQELGHVIGAKLGACKHQYLAPVVLVDDVRQQGLLLAATH